jgi:hypothetical protein
LQQYKGLRRVYHYRRSWRTLDGSNATPTGTNNDFTGNQAVDAASEATNNAIINNNCFPCQKYN